ncbi:ORF6 [Halogeometricum pleomorphic virus 1]|uniref:ORF6 n=1 Tax=Halogeometricum pleomorphic virus 1 TaxID=1156722 RepID=H9ABQ7_9VIRU|nr:ORF6 [Halogeometricum pleomorphic virus 1]AFD04027.1 ORF6 [Halogeometricum pleomorphic virus 1]
MKDWLKLGAIGGAFVWWGGVEIPSWVSVAVVGVAFAVGAGYVASSKIEELEPDPRSVRVVQVNGNGEPLKGWALSPDKFAETEVKWGPLYPHDTDSEYEVYEAYAFSEDKNVAVGTWRRSLPGSEVVGQFDVDDVMGVIADYRARIEPDARRLTAMKTSLPAIVRELEFHRAEMQSSALDPSSPMKMDTPTVEDVIVDHMPEELRPGHLQQGDLASLLEVEDEPNDWGDGLDLVIEDEGGDALEPVDQPLMNDGGQHE